MSGPRHQHAIELTVSPADIDDLGHVNNAVYLQYMESVARAHADHVGASLDVMRALGAVPVARKHTIVYHRPALVGERLRVTTEIVSARGVRATRHNEVRRAETGELLAEADSDWVWVDPARGRPKAIPRELAAAFGTDAPQFTERGAAAVR